MRLTDMKGKTAGRGDGWGWDDRGSTWANRGYLHVWEDTANSDELAGGLLVGILAGPDETSDQSSGTES